MSFKEKKNREKETITKEENPVFLAQASSPARMGFQESSLHFKAEGKVLEHPSGHVLTLPWTVIFPSLQDGETAFQSTAPGEAAGTRQLALAPWEVFWLSGKHGPPRLSASLKLMELYKRVKTSTYLIRLQARSLPESQYHLPGTSVLPSKPSKLAEQCGLPGPSVTAGTWNL